jgi:hypothetical protein
MRARPVLWAALGTGVAVNVVTLSSAVTVNAVSGLGALACAGALMLPRRGSPEA